MIVSKQTTTNTKQTRVSVECSLPYKTLRKYRMICLRA